MATKTRVYMRLTIRIYNEGGASFLIDTSKFYLPMQMQSKPFAQKELLSPMKEEGVHTACSAEMEKMAQNVNLLTLTTTHNEAESVECECCGMSEDCTPTYIHRIRELFRGKWICGLCSEAVKERLKRASTASTMEEALDSHTALCKKFNRTTKLNPQLSLVGALRDIARKSSKKRISEDGRLGGPRPRNVARTLSCGPRMGA